jgi:hypothetical protein
MKYAAEVASSIVIGSGIQKLMGQVENSEKRRHTETQQNADSISLF